MRILSLGLMALLLTGTALTLSDNDFVRTALNRFSDAAPRKEMVFEPTAEQPSFAGSAKVAFLRENVSAPLILSGLPSYGSARFGLPVDSRPESGYLQLDTTLQTLKGVEGLLRVSINNTRRAEVLLVPGETTRSVQVPLTGEELSKDSLTVSFSLVGTAPASSCAGQDHLAVVAEIEASSSLVLTLDTPLQSSRDRIIAWGNEVRIGWADFLRPEDRADRIAMAATLRQQGAKVTFSTGDALDWAALRDYIRDVGQLPAATDDALVFPVALQAAGNNSGARVFKRSTTWRTRYQLDENRADEIPGHVDFGLHLGPLPAGAQWTVSATLNGRLLIAEALEEGARDFSTNLALPPTAHARDNLLEVTAASTADLAGECNAGPDLIAELTDTSVLEGSGRFMTGTLGELRTELRAQTDVGISVTGDMTAADAASFTRMIAAVMPGPLSQTATSDAAMITPLSRAEATVLSAGDLTPDETWIVTYKDDQETLQAVRGTADALADLKARAPLALLIRVSPLRSASVLQ